jgi:general stress protein 26
MPFPESHQDLFEKSYSFHLSTVDAAGHPHIAPVWCVPDGNVLLLVIERGSPSEINVRQNPRVSVLAYDRENPLHNMEIRGEIVEIGKDDDSLSQQVREIDNTVCVRMAPMRIRVEG